MNVIFISPHFPPNFQSFVKRLKEEGASVLGLSDVPYEHLGQEVQSNLTEYYRVNDMHNYDDVLRAVGYLTYRFGKIDRIDSLNEYWLELEAKVRTDFNIFGFQQEDIMRIKRKSEMKRVFQSIGLDCAAGEIFESEKQARLFIKKVGYPIVAKPDIGVGAAQTYKIENDTDLKSFIKENLDCDYIMEAFIEAPIVTFDGLTDHDGNIVFSASHRYSQGIMEVVNADSDVYYWGVRDIEPELEKIGRNIVKAFNVKERFFHFEFFMGKGGKITALEVNMRPPGGMTVDMFNYANNFDCYRAWAELLVHGKTSQAGKRPYFVIYVGRKDTLPYRRDHDTVLGEFESLVVHHARVSDVFSRAIGNYGYILRHEKLDPLIKAATEIQERTAKLTGVSRNDIL
ncbi:MAG: ATP-grasp domain-containing protein [Candidatus Obscuribacterales bacterium]|nr:ATP-grasp domain-containing protein [Candidatus Obscuribacterales bacterium]